MKKLLMISYPYPPNFSAGAVRSERFARYLKNFQWETEIITIKPGNDKFKDYNKNIKIRNVHFTKNIDPWLWAMQKNPKGLILRALRSAIIKLFSFPDHMLLWVPFALKKSIEICKKERVDAIYTTSPPHSTHLAGLMLTRITGIQWVCDFRDPWTLNAYHAKGGIQNLLLKIEEIVEKAVLKDARLVLANTESNLKKLINAFPDIDSRKIVHVPNGWEPFSEQYDRRTEKGPLTIIHAGTFYPKFNPYGLLCAIAAWRKGEVSNDFPVPGPDQLKIVLLGSRDTTTADTIKNLDLEDIVQIEAWVPLEEARKRMCRADFLWATLGTRQESSTYIPSKLFEYISAGKPIIGFFPEGEAKRLIADTGTGIVFSSDQPEKIIAYLHERIVEKENILLNPMKIGNVEYINTLKFENIVKRFSKLLDGISKIMRF